jgi:hypothetical protein
MSQLHSGLTPGELLDECWRTLDQLQVNQSQIFIDLGQTAQEREEIALLLADICYTTGFMRLSKERMQNQLDHDDLLILIQGYLRQEKKESVLHTLEVIQAKKYRYPHGRISVEREDHDPRSDDPETASDPVSQVPGAISLRTRRNIYQRVGIRRDTRRTAKCDDRSVPDPDMLA